MKALSKRILSYLTVFLFILNLVPAHLALAEDADYTETVLWTDTFTGLTSSDELSAAEGWSVSGRSGSARFDDEKLVLDLNYNAEGIDGHLTRTINQGGEGYIEFTADLSEVGDAIKASTQRGTLNLCYLYGANGVKRATKIEFNYNNQLRISTKLGVTVVTLPSWPDSIKMKLSYNCVTRELGVAYQTDTMDAYTDVVFGNGETTVEWFEDEATGPISKMLIGMGNIKTGFAGNIKIDDVKCVKIRREAAPVASNVTVSVKKNVLTGSYEFSDANDDEEGNSVSAWYVSETGEEGSFSAIPGENEKTLSLGAEDDGKYYQYGITPFDTTGRDGEEARSEAFHFEYQEPIIYAIPEISNLKAETYGNAVLASYDFVADERLEDTADYSECQWYVSDSLFGEYEIIEGATDKLYNGSRSMLGKFLKFTVTPMDSEGNRGETLEAFPIMLNSGQYLDFEDDAQGVANFVYPETGSGGYAGITDDPTGRENRVMAITRTENVAGKAVMLDYTVDLESTAPYYMLDIDLYVDKNLTQTELFYLIGTGSHITKLYTTNDIATVIEGTGDGKGGFTTTRIPGGFKRGEWHHARCVINNDADTFDFYVDDMDTPVLQNARPRYPGSLLNTMRSYLQANNLGSIYWDNLAVAAHGVDYSENINTDYAELNIEGNLDAVTDDLYLPVKGKNKTVISWHSSDESVITKDGKVTRPSTSEPDAEVTLTAYIQIGSQYREKVYNVKVLNEFTDEETVSMDAESLEFFNNKIIEENVVLPDAGKYGSSIVWQTSDAGAIDINGVINRGSSDKFAVLTATVAFNGETRTVTLPVCILKDNNLRQLKDTVISASSENASYPVEKIDDNDFTTIYKSGLSDDAVTIIVDYRKIRSLDSVLLASTPEGVEKVTVYNSNDNTNWSKTFEAYDITEGKPLWIDLSVKAKYLKFEFVKKSDVIGIAELRSFETAGEGSAVEDDYEELKLDIDEIVKSDFSLVTSLPSGSSVTWISENENVIRIEGNIAVVTRAEKNTIVKLIATVSFNGTSKNKEFYVTVLGKGSGGSGGGGGGGSFGGGGGSSSGGSSFIASSPESEKDQLVPYTSESYFNDIKDVSWAEDAIVELVSKGILKGTGEGKFEPYRSITREEFVSLLCRILELPEGEKVEFDDIDPDAWYVEALSSAYHKGIINGIDEKNFGVGKPISRQDMAVMICRAFSIDIESAEGKFNDDDGIAQYAKEAVSALNKAGIIKGDGNGNFLPNNPTSRAECAVVLMRLLKIK